MKVSTDTVYELQYADDAALPSHSPSDLQANLNTAFLTIVKLSTTDYVRIHLSQVNAAWLTGGQWMQHVRYQKFQMSQWIQSTTGFWHILCGRSCIPHSTSGLHFLYLQSLTFALNVCCHVCAGLPLCITHVLSAENTSVLPPSVAGWHDETAVGAVWFMWHLCPVMSAEPLLAMTRFSVADPCHSATSVHILRSLNQLNIVLYVSFDTGLYVAAVVPWTIVHLAYQCMNPMDVSRNWDEGSSHSTNATDWNSNIISLYRCPHVRGTSTALPSTFKLLTAHWSVSPCQEAATPTWAIKSRILHSGILPVVLHFSPAFSFPLFTRCHSHIPHFCTPAFYL